MTTRIALVLLTLTFGITTAAAAQSKAQSDADVREVASYRLTMEAVDKAAVAMRAMAAEMKKDSRFQGMMKIETDIKALEKKDEPPEGTVGTRIGWPLSSASQSRKLST